MAALTNEQVEMVKNTWKVPAANLMDSGEAILYSFFERYPIHQQKFASFKNVPLGELKGSPGFRSHANRIMTVFDDSIKELGKEDGMENIAKIWDALGHSHARRKIEPKAFLELRGVILEILTALINLDKSQQETWGALIDVVYSVAFNKMQK